MKGLTQKQRRFVAEYLKDQNAKQAAIRAGYSKSSAETDGPRLLRNAQVRAAVEAKLGAIMEKVEVTKEFVLSGLKTVAQRCMQATRVLEFDHEEKAMVPKVDADGNNVFEFDSAGANRSFELLGKHLALFTDRILVADSLEKLLAGTNPPREK